MAIPGIDVSNNNGPVDWQQVASSGVRFAWVKATEGARFVDKYAAGHVEQAEAAGIAVGCYHFARPGTNSPDTEAQHFLAHLPTSCHLRPVLDLEVTTLDVAGTVRWAKRWLTLVTLAGYQPILYTYSGFAQAHLDDSLGAWPLWLANYRATPPRPPAGWDSFVAWQHADNGNVPGVSGHVDMNLADSLAPLLASSTTPPEDDMTPDQFAAALRANTGGMRDALLEVLEAQDVKTFTDKTWKLARAQSAAEGVEMFWLKIRDKTSGWADALGKLFPGWTKG